MEIKLKDLFSKTKNSCNKQTNLSIKKKELKKLNISEDKLLNMKVNYQLNKLLQDD